MMSHQRFGRRLPVPSTLAIRTELREAIALDQGRERIARENGLAADTGWEAIGTHLADAERRAAALKPAA